MTDANRLPPKYQKNEKDSESGQAITEFLILMILLIAGMALFHSRTNIFLANYWQKLANRIITMCPECRSSKPAEIKGLQEHLSK